MATEIVMPALGIAQETGRVVQWLAAEGETVTAGEPLLEIETDKVTVSIDAPASGVLSAVRAGDGDEVSVGKVIAFILAPGEEPPEPPAEPAPEGGEAERVSAGAPDARREPAADGAAPRAPGSGGRREASPLARRRAREAGIDLERVHGTGPGGAVTAADLDAVLAAGVSTDMAAAQPEVGAIWRRMAERVTASWTSAPHFYLTREVDAERLVAWRTALGEGVTLTDLLVWLSARALQRHPEANAVWDGDAPKRIGEINVGIAVAVADGLIVPVVHRVNEPQAAILAVGRVADRVVAVEGRPLVAPRMTMSLSCDHRVLDGARAARFLDTFVTFVEEPLQLVT